jgi:3-deoxy-manno-octulosonate cytidylyltransferase (CMP-KDO synthetase)
MKFCIVIPARLKSTRLPLKMLADINGKPMIVRVFENCKKTNIKDVFVATDSLDIKSAIESIGGTAILTDEGLQSGTDRVFQALTTSGLLQNFDGIVNVQGDVPNISPDVINHTASLIKDVKMADISTAVVKITDKEKMHNSNVVKAVLSIKGDDWGRALYFSREAIPYGDGDFYEHIGIYAYKKDALRDFVSFNPSLLEKTEKLEQLRALENDLNIFAKIVNFNPISVDAEEDLNLARKLIL